MSQSHADLIFGRSLFESIVLRRKIIKRSREARKLRSCFNPDTEQVSNNYFSIMTESDISLPTIKV